MLAVMHAFHCAASCNIDVGELLEYIGYRSRSFRIIITIITTLDMIPSAAMSAHSKHHLLPCRANVSKSVLTSTIGHHYDINPTINDGVLLHTGRSDL